MIYLCLNSCKLFPNYMKEQKREELMFRVMCKTEGVTVISKSLEERRIEWQQKEKGFLLLKA